MVQVSHEDVLIRVNARDGSQEQPDKSEDGMSMMVVILLGVGVLAAVLLGLFLCVRMFGSNGAVAEPIVSKVVTKKSKTRTKVPKSPIAKAVKNKPIVVSEEGGSCCGCCGGGEINYTAQLLRDTKKQARFVPNTAEEDDVTDSLRHPNAEKEFSGFLPIDRWSKLDNCLKGMERAAREYPDRNCLGWRPFLKKSKDRGDYTYSTYKETWDEMQALGRGFHDLIGTPNAHVGIYGANRPEWLISSYGLYCQNYKSVALYDTLGQEAIQHILGHADLEAVSCEKKNLANLLKAVRSAGSLPLKYVIVWDYDKRYGNHHEKVTDKDRADAKKLGLKLVGMSEVLARGRKSKRKTEQPKADDLAFIMYTSGTTGLPKGVKLTHGNFCAAVSSMWRYLEPKLGKDAVQKHVSFLPLAHAFEQSVQMVLLYRGGTIAYQQGNIRKLTDDWKSIRPTILCGVPRVYARIYDKVNASTKARWILKVASIPGFSWLRSFVLSQFGWGNVKVIVSGAAPLPPYLGDFLRSLTGAHVFQGYGMTETTALGTRSSSTDPTVGHCGIPFDNVEVRLQSVPEMKYLITDTILVDGKEIACPRGEIQMRGPSIFKGYYKQQDKTDQTINEKGWLLSGDIGRINPNGTVSIIDRKKNIFKTAFGEYIAVEKVEGEYQKAPAVGQIWVYGNSYKSNILAVVVPDSSWAVNLLKAQNLWSSDGKLSNEEFAKKFSNVAGANKNLLRKGVLAEMKKVEGTLKKLERPKDIIIETEVDTLMQGFNVANDCLTPTMKLRRPQLLDRYRDQLKALYTSIGEAPQQDENW